MANSVYHEDVRTLLVPLYFSNLHFDGPQTNWCPAIPNRLRQRDIKDLRR
jgi:hypothetical protein